MDPGHEFWERSDVVERFASREPDLRLRLLLDELPPGRALDVGCAGGRNTVLLAQGGWDVHALDASGAMVEATRARVAAILGAAAARRRVRPGRMDRLTFPAEHFDLVVSLGVLHIAEHWDEWCRAADEIARVLRPGGCVLISQFTPDSRPGGETLTRVAAEPCVYAGYSRGRAVLLDPATLDAEMARRALRPVSPTGIAAAETERGRRVSAVALYRKLEHPR